MNKFVVGIMMIASLLGCGKREPETVRLRMEVGYPMLGDLTGSPRLWAIYRFHSSMVSELTPGDAVAASVICSRGARCVVDRVEKNSDSLPVNRPLWINGRVVQVAQGGHELALILEPFPINWTGQIEQLRFKQGETKLIDVDYLPLHGRLVLKQATVVGVANRPPIVWK